MDGSTEEGGAGLPWRTERGGAGVSIERWDMDGVPTVAVVAHRGEVGFVALVSYDRGTRAWETGSAPFVPGGEPPDRAWASREVRFDGARRTDMIDLGVVGEGRGLAGALAGLMLGVSVGARNPHDENEDGEVFPGAAHWAEMAAFVFGVADRGDRRGSDGPAHGFADPGRARLMPVARGAAYAAGPGIAAEAERLAETISWRLRGAVHGLADPVDREVLEMLGEANWSCGAHAFYAYPGRIGQRRRQAARLYPALAPLIAHRRSVSALVDVARPYEAALLEGIRGMLPEGDGAAIPAAGVRRLRALAPCPFGDVARAAALLAALPVDWIPRDAEGWRGILAYVGRDMGEMASAGVRAADLVGHAGGDWKRLAAAFPALDKRGAMEMHRWLGGGMDERGGIAGVLIRARDMRVRLAETLVGQVRESLGIDEPAGGDRRLAGRILFGGRSLAGIERLQARWHAGLSRLEADLPAHEAGNAWPAAFPPFRAANGLEIACLTDEAQLKDEGAAGPDREGRPGLDHCVGGYGRQCHAGECHVASVRRPGPDGYERVSTVEFTPHMHEGLAGVLFVDQHLGRANAPPPAEAERAFAELCEAVAKGAHPLDPAAVGERASEGFRDAYEWRVPGAMERAYAAWSGYLPGDVRGGLAALGVRIAAEAARMDGEPRPEPDGAIVLDIEACGLGMR